VAICPGGGRRLLLVAVHCSSYCSLVSDVLSTSQSQRPEHMQLDADTNMAAGRLQAIAGDQ
jgi:hypothetical protein